MGFRRRMGDCLATAARHIAREELSTHLQLLNWDFVVSGCFGSMADVWLTKSSHIADRRTVNANGGVGALSSESRISLPSLNRRLTPKPER